MKKIILSFCAVIFFYLHAYTQEIVKVPDFGKVDISELQMKDCSFEPGVSAMNLLRYEEVEFEVTPYGDYKMVTEVTCRIKIFDKNGYKNASIVIPYTGKNRTSRITDVEGTTYNLDENGKIVKSDINRKEIFKDKSSENDGLNSVRFTFPDVKPGCVIEYKYTKIEKKSYFISPWFFQTDIPTLLSACKITSPSIVRLDKKAVALLPVEEASHKVRSNSNYWSIYEKSFAMRNIPSFKAEPLMSSLKDNLQRMEFSLVPQISFLDILNNATLKWSIFNSILLRAQFFGQQFDVALQGSENFIDSIRNVDTAEKINATYNFVKRNISWDNHRTFYADDITQVWKDKIGNSAEINIILLNLLRKAGVECYPVLISTRENGKIDISFPNMSQFNGVDVIALYKDDFYVLDATENHISYKVPPFNVLNRDAFIVDENNSKWVNLRDTRSLIKDSVSVIASLKDDGSITGEADITYYDLSRAEKIEQENRDEKEQEDDYLLNDAPDLKVDTSYEIDKDNELKPLKEVIKFHYDLPATNDFYFLNPFIMSTFRKNPFTDSIRRTDIDFGANSSFLLHMEIDLPEHIKVEELTKNKIIRTPDTVLLFNRFNELNGNKIIVDSRFDINDAVFDKTDYPAIKDFFQNIYAILNQQILLKKKEE